MFNAITIGLLAFTLLFGVSVGSLGNELYMSTMFPILMAYLAVSLIRKTFFTAEALTNKKENDELNNYHLKLDTMVSIIVPCYNEGKVIVNTLTNLSKLKHPNYEVIVVDDGSTDDTFSKAMEFKAKHPSAPIKVISKDNGGKASALNLGIEKAIGELIMCVDGDSCLHLNSIVHGLRYFTDPTVGAVAGFVEVHNQNNLLTKFQEFEYLLGLNYPRRGLANYGVVPIVPGPVGLFRKKALESIEGYLEDKKLMAEDAEITLRLINAGWKIKSNDKMVAYTEAPEDEESLLRQRYRWNRGIIQALKLNLKTLWKSNKLLSMHLLFETYGVLFANLLMIISFITHGIVQGQMQLLDKWLIGLLAIEALSTFIAVADRPNKLKWIGNMLLSSFTYNLMLLFWRAFSIVDESLDIKMTWDKLERKGVK